MDIEVDWTEFAKRELRKIFNYYIKKAMLKIARKIVTQITTDANALRSSPKLGPVEETLKTRSREFRYLVSTNYKIIYWINLSMDRIEILDVFDTRQNPKKIERNK